MRTKFEDIVASCQIRFDRGDSATWKHSDFLDLSREILRNTKVSISTNTLKRIFGKIAVDQYYIPQQATIQALEKYGQHYQLEQKPELVAEKQEFTPIQITKKPLRRKIFLSVAITSCLLIIIFLLIRKYDKNEIDLRLTDMEGTTPATAFFEYSIPKHKDSIFLNFGDKTGLVYVEPGKAHLAHPYIFQGVFPVTLQTRRDTLKSINIFIPSNKWMGLGYRQGNELTKNYYEFQAVKTGRDSLFYISNQQLIAKGVDTSGLVYTRLYNYTPVTYKGEDFIFEASFKNVVDKTGVYCKSTQFQISGMKNRIRFRLTTPGCSNRITNIISEKTFIGTKVNLSKFAMDLSEWTTVKLINKDKMVSLYVNENLIYSGNYQQSIGEIKGLFLEFEGTAFVKSCSLKTNEGNTIYQF